MKFRIAIPLCAIVTLSALLIPLDMAAQAAFITFDAPGALRTFPKSINPAGAVAGYYVDANTVNHGFLRAREGTITTFDAPGAGTVVGLFEGTFPLSINPAGAITGNYADEFNVSHGFLRAPDGNITTFDVPDARSTWPTSINPERVIAGYFFDTSNVSHGFLRERDGTITTFEAPGAGTGMSEGTNPRSINPARAITGDYVIKAGSSLVRHGFLRARGGTITTFDVPDALSTWPTSINVAGVIAGFYFLAPTVIRGFLRARDGTITTFEGPDAFITGPTSINEAGVITGSYITKGSSIVHGFLRARDGDITTFDVPDAVSTGPASINPEGAITGQYTVMNSVVHGFVRIPCDRDEDRECERE